MEEQKTTILVVEDDLDISEMLNAYFRVLGYDVLTVNWGEDGVRACQTHLPDLVILDIRLPDIDGFEVARRILSTRRTKNIPIIFLTEKRERMDRLRGLELSAEDYITKPFDVQELRLRVRNVLDRARRANIINPITGVSDGQLVEEHLTKFLENPSMKLIVLSLRKVDRFKDTYGFIATDDMLRAVAMMIKDILKEDGTPEDFLGHLTATDFVLLSWAPDTSQMQDKLARRLNQSFQFFYSQEDCAKPEFRDSCLSVRIKELPSHGRATKDLHFLRTQLEQIYR